VKSKYSKCGQDGHIARNKKCPLFGSNPSSSSQNFQSSGIPQNTVESDESENEDENEEPGDVGEDSDDDIDGDDNLQSSEDWMPETICDFESQSPRQTTRNSSPITINLTEDPAINELLPKFKGYNGRGQFNGVNKQVVSEANCGRSPLKFFMLFITDAILQAFVVATNYYANTYHRNHWVKDLDVTPNLLLCVTH